MNTHARRLDALMDTRRLELGLRWKGVVERAGITHQTLLQLRKGQPVADLTIARVEQALEWAPGSIAQIAEGGDPIPLPPPSPEPENAPRSGRYRPVQVPEGLDPDDEDVQRIQAMKLPPKKKFMYLLQLLEVIEENEQEGKPGRHAG